MADVRITHFARVAQEKLYQGYQFLLNSTNHSEYVKGVTVEVPQAGTIPDITKNRSSYPMTVAQRDDDKVSYNIDRYDIGAILIPPEDLEELSYNKVNSLMSQTMNKLNERIGKEGMYTWTEAGGASTILRTTGDATAKGPGTATAKKALTLDDLAGVANELDKANFDRDLMKRHIILPADIYHNFYVENKEVLSKDYMETANLPTGAIGRVLGLNIYVVPHTVVYSSDAATKRAIGAATQATDSWACVAYHQDAVAHAKTSPRMSVNADRAEYNGGNLYSGYVRFGSVILRSDNSGIVTVVQNA